MAEANYFKKRSPRISRSRLSYSSASEDDGKGPIAVPEGLRAILNEIAREVRLILLIGIFLQKLQIGIFYKNCKNLSVILFKITINLGIDIF